MASDRVLDKGEPQNVLQDKIQAISSPDRRRLAGMGSRIDRWGVTMEREPISECVRCGTCCGKGGPAFHHEDKMLIEQGIILSKHLYTIRAGEPVYDNVTNYKLECRPTTNFLAIQCKPSFMFLCCIQDKKLWVSRDKHQRSAVLKHELIIARNSGVPGGS